MSQAARIAIQVLGGLLLILIIYLSLNQVWSWKKAAEANAATVRDQAATADTTGEIAQDLGSKTTDAKQVEIVVVQKRGEYDDQYQRLKASDPDVADWANGVVPQRLRDLARARRTARDGSGTTQAGGPPADTATGGSRPDPAPGPS